MSRPWFAKQAGVQAPSQSDENASEIDDTTNQDGPVSLREGESEKYPYELRREYPYPYRYPTRYRGPAIAHANKASLFFVMARTPLRSCLCGYYAGIHGHFCSCRFRIR